MRRPDAIRLAIAGLGRGFMLMLPTLRHHPSVRVVAAADPQPGGRERFEATFEGARAYDSVEAMCADPQVEAVYVATPHECHLEHVLTACRAGKHVMVEKPMALTIAECRAMVEAAEANGVHLMVGHSHGLDRPYLAARDLVRSGRFGRVRMISALNFTDYLYRPRRPAELDTAQGGGVLFSQAPHQIDVVRMLAQSEIWTVRATTGVWDLRRPTEGAYNALLQFEDGSSATLVYNGYGHFDTDEWNDWIGEMGTRRDPSRYGEARARLAGIRSPEEEAGLKETRNFASSGPDAAELPVRLPGYNHFGVVIVSCERGDLRPTPTGVGLYGEESRDFHALPAVEIPRSEVVDELYGVLRDGCAPLRDGRSAMMTVAGFLAIQRSAAEGREIAIDDIVNEDRSAR